MTRRGGMIVICAGTTGFNLTMDARYLWMHQKRVQGSHFANLMQAAAANKLVMARRIDPCMSEVYSWADIPKAHMKMWKNEHRPGNMAVLVSACRTPRASGPWTTRLRPRRSRLGSAPRVQRQPFLRPDLLALALQLAAGGHDVAAARRADRARHSRRR